MATAPSTSTPGSALDLPDRRAALRTERLAEMVAGLTGCKPDGALDAVRTQVRDNAAGDAWGPTDPLEIVARAILALGSGETPSGAARPDPVVVDLRDDPPVVSIDLTGLAAIDRRYRL